MSEEEKCNGHCREHLLRIEWCPECLEEAYRIAVSKPPSLHSNAKVHKRDWGDAVCLSARDWKRVREWTDENVDEKSLSNDLELIRIVKNAKDNPIAKKRMTPEVIRESLKVR